MEKSITPEGQNVHTDRPPKTTPTAQISGCLDVVVLLLVSGGIALVSFIRHSATLTITINPDQARAAALIGVGIQFVALSIVLIPLALFWPSPRRKVYQAWLLVHFLGLLFSPAFLTGLTAKQDQALFQILVGGVFLLLTPLFYRWLPQFHPKDAPVEVAPAQIQDGPAPRLNLWAAVLLIGMVVGYPWLALGALGSITDTLLMGLLGLLMGLIAGAIMPRAIFEAEPSSPETFWGQIFMNGIGLSTLLLLLAGALAFSYGGIQILELVALPGLGWLIVLLHAITSPPAQNTQAGPETRRLIGSALPFAILVGISAAFPLLFVDPNELILVLGASPGEILGDAFRAAFLSAGSIVVLDLLLIFLLAIRGQRAAAPSRGRSGFSWVSGLLVALLAGGFALAVYLYGWVGQPGFYGEDMFVILKDQAALNGVPGGLDYNQRRQAVFVALTKQADQSQQKIRATLDRFGVPYTPYYLVNAIEVQGSPILRLWLLTRPEVDRILDNPTLRPLPGPLPVQGGNSAPPDGVPWNLTLIGADRVWQEFNVRGAGILVGQSDSGVDGSHPELADSYRGQNGQNDFNWLDPWYHTTAPTDIGGHGTHTLGTILGDHTGVAPDAQWIACVNLARNLGNPGLYLDCMQFMLAPFPQKGDPFTDGNPALGAQVLNNSWGCPDVEGCDAKVFQPAISALRTAGVFVVASAGNDGPKCASLNVPPPIYPDAFAVGAIDQGGQLAPFSSLGPVDVLPDSPVKPNLVAPGVSVLSSLPKNTYGAFSGTSMAGPHVVGTVALMWSANPNLIGNIDLTQKLLEQAASPYQGSLPDCPGADQTPSTAVGYGVLNAYKAVQLAIDAK